MDNLIIESSNWLWLITAGFATWRVCAWRAGNHLSDDNHSVVNAWIWIFGAGAVNKGWFALSRHLSPEDSYWHQGMFEWRWLVVLLTALAFSWGMLKFIQLIDGFSMTKQIGLFAVSFIFAVGIGFY
jgi:hypothetical protein